MGFDTQLKGPGMGAQNLLGARSRDIMSQLPRGAGPEDLVDFFTRLSAPQFEGPMAEELDPLQLASMDRLTQLLRSSGDISPEDLTAALSEIAGGTEYAPGEVGGILGEGRGRGTLEEVSAGGWMGDLGIHAHDNMEQAFANSKAAVDAGAT